MIRHTLCSPAKLASAVALLLAGGAAAPASAQAPIMTCDAGGIGSVELEADGPAVDILEVSTGTAGDVPYCLVKVLVPQAVNIWVGLPMDGKWNGRWQSVGGGVYAGQVSVPTAPLRDGFAGATTDTGHSTNAMDGKFGMLEPGKPNEALQIDFAYRSEHLMAVLGNSS